MGGLASTQKTPAASQIVIDPSICPTTPDWKTGNTTAEPNYGFEGKRRKERVMIATPAELASAKVPKRFRDYCAHKFIAYEACKRDQFPFCYRCHHEKHDWDNCVADDYVIRMKEFERERRLLHRKQRKEKAAGLAAAYEE